MGKMESWYLEMDTRTRPFSTLLVPASFKARRKPVQGQLANGVGSGYWGWPHFVSSTCLFGAAFFP